MLVGGRTPVPRHRDLLRCGPQREPLSNLRPRFWQGRRISNGEKEAAASKRIPIVRSSSTFKVQLIKPTEAGNDAPYDKLLVYLPGTDGTGQAILPQIPALHSLGYDIWCLYMPPDDRSDWEQLTTQLTLLLRQLLQHWSATRQPGGVHRQGAQPPRITIVAESFGCCLALRLAATGAGPELLDRLVLVNPATSFNDSFSGLSSFIAATNLLSLFPRDWYGVAQTTLLPLLVDGERVDEANQRLLQSMILMEPPASNQKFGFGATRSSRQVVAASPDGDAPKMANMASEMKVSETAATAAAAAAAGGAGNGGGPYYAPAAAANFRANLLRSGNPGEAVLRGVVAPVLLITSARDRLLPSILEGARLERALPNARRYILPDSGHAALLERGVNLAAILRSMGFSTDQNEATRPSSAQSVSSRTVAARLMTEQPSLWRSSNTAAAVTAAPTPGDNSRSAAAAPIGTTPSVTRGVAITSGQQPSSSGSVRGTAAGSREVSGVANNTDASTVGGAPVSVSSAAAVVAAESLVSTTGESPSTPEGLLARAAKVSDSWGGDGGVVDDGKSSQAQRGGSSSSQRRRRKPKGGGDGDGGERKAATVGGGQASTDVDSAFDEWCQKLAPWRDIVSPVVLGFEHLPQPGSAPFSRPMLFVGNHQKMGFYDTPLLVYELYVRGYRVRGLAHPGHWAGPFGRWFESFGSVKASPMAAFRLLRASEKVLLFPGGAKEVVKKRGQEYTLLWKESPDFVRLAARCNALIVPFAAVGADDAYDVIMDTDEVIAHPVLGPLTTGLLSQVSSALNPVESIFPITRLPVVGLPTLIPIPNLQRLYFQFAPPIDPCALGTNINDPEQVQNLYDGVKGTVTQCMAELLAVRDADDESQLGARLAKSLQRIAPVLGLAAFTPGSPDTTISQK